MTIQLFNQQNQLVQSGTTNESGVNYQTVVDPETYEVRGSLFIQDLQLSANDYLKFLRAITTKNAAYFKIIQDDGSELILSTLFLKDINFQYVASRLSLRTGIVINEENSQQFETFMQQFS